MRKSEYSARVRSSARATSARASRYRQTTASARSGLNDSNHSLREIAHRKGRRQAPNRRGKADYSDVEISEAQKSYNANSASKFGRAKLDRSMYHWYAVVIGRKRGLFHGYHLAWKQVNGFKKGRAYKHIEFQDAMETFMRWKEGKRIHAHDSTMQTRGRRFQVLRRR